MFTGIVESVGEVTSRDASDDGVQFSVNTNLAQPDRLDIGDSLAVSGACLTVVRRQDSQVDVFVSNRSLRDTRFSDIDVGTRVNIETALTLNEPLGGHIVTGHVDGVAHCVDRAQSGASILFEFAVEQSIGIGQFIAPQGSVALDGVSLTVKSVADVDQTTRFSVNIIPHTLEVTTFGDLAVGDVLHVEADMLARYAGRFAEYFAQPDSTG